MRFSLAIGILAPTLAAASKPDDRGIMWPRGGAAQRKKRVKSILKNGDGVPPRGENGSNVRQGPGLKRLRTKSNSILRNKARTNPAEIDCDPSSSDPDVGILSCGMGKYCAEMKDRALGGLCVDAAEDQRNLQEAVPAPYEVTISSYCDPTSEIFGKYECDCTNFDLVSGTGSFECLFYEEECFSDAAVETCATVVGAADVAADGSYVTSTCYDFFKPYDQSVCFEYSSTGICAIDFNGVQCDSCARTDYVVPGDENIVYESFCLEFDCRNTDGMHMGNECDGDNPILIFDYMPEEHMSMSMSMDMSMSMSMDMSMSMPTERMSMSMSGEETHMSMSTEPGGRRELHEIRDERFGRNNVAGVKKGHSTIQSNTEKRVRKRV